MVLYLAQLKVQCLVIPNVTNLEKSLVVNKFYCLVYLSGLFKESFKVPCLAILKDLYDIIHLLYMKEVQNETGVSLCLD